MKESIFDLMREPGTVDNNLLQILSADDDTDDQDLLEEAISKTPYGFVLKRCSNGLQLLKELNRIEAEGELMPDVIFLDLNMPVMNGREALIRLKENSSKFRQIPIAILTTSNSHEDIRFCKSQGAEAFLVKPTRFSDFIFLVENFLRDLILKSGSS